MLRIALPNKGRLADRAADLMARSGIHVRPPNDRMLIHTLSGGEYRILYTRPADIPEFIETGAADVGITGLDQVLESSCDVQKVLDLDFGRCRLVIAAAENSKFTDLESLPTRTRVATAFPNLTRRFFEKRAGPKVKVVPITGAAEIAPHIGVADLIVDLSETGTTLSQNHLTLVDVVMDSWAILVASPAALRRRQEAVETLASALQSVMNAAKRRYLMANARKKDVAAISKLLPGLSAPTVMDLSTRGMVAVHAVVDEDQINRLIPRLKKAGASGVLVLPIERLVP